MAAAHKRAGLSHADLAIARGHRHDQTMTSHVEAGRSVLLLDGAIKAAGELGVSFGYLVGLADDPTRGSSGGWSRFERSRWRARAPRISWS